MISSNELPWIKQQFTLPWSILRPDGGISDVTYRSRRQIIEDVFGRKKWPEFYRKGYRLIRVQLVPMI
jgi:hypothetical protein